MQPAGAGGTALLCPLQALQQVGEPSPRAETILLVPKGRCLHLLYLLISGEARFPSCSQEDFLVEMSP